VDMLVAAYLCKALVSTGMLLTPIYLLSIADARNGKEGRETHTQEHAFLCGGDQ
jgi:hypothetical protein